MYNNSSSSARGPSAPIPAKGQQSPQQPQYGDYSYQHAPYNSYQGSTPVRNSQATQPPSGGNLASIRSKFSPQDITVLKQLLGAGEKHKWKQITKEINQSSTSNRDSFDGQYNGQKSQASGKNVSPTFVIKQYQTLIGLPNNALYFGTLGSSLPYVVGASGWDDLNDSAYQHQFGDDVE